jgi:3D (Asp-Asp-Asp) domain-containing protein
MTKFILKIKSLISRHQWLGYLAVASLCLRLALMPEMLAATAQETPAMNYSRLTLEAIGRPNLSDEDQSLDNSLILQNGTFVQSASLPDIKLSEAVFLKKSTTKKTINLLKNLAQQIMVTAYSSTADQTDSTPFITANGAYVYDGLVACNFLPFGARVRFPEIYGDKVFVVEDRMAKKNSHKMDIWMSSRELALQFGVKRLTVEILE